MCCKAAVTSNALFGLAVADLFKPRVLRLFLLSPKGYVQLQPSAQIFALESIRPLAQYDGAGEENNAASGCYGDISRPPHRILPRQVLQI